MLTDIEKQEIDQEIPKYETTQAVSIEALKIVQRNRRWINDEAIRDVSTYLGITAEDLESVATFYNLIFRKPVGRHVILICNSITCWVMGYEHLLDHIKNTLGIGLGETTPDGRFTLLPTVCLGICDHSPAVMIDDDTHVDLDNASFDAILAQYT